MIIKRRKGQKNFGMVGNIREGVEGIVDDISPLPLPTVGKAKKTTKGLGNFLTGEAESKDDE